MNPSDFFFSPPFKFPFQDAYNKAEELLLLTLNEWGRALASSGSLAPIWIEVLGDLFLRRLLLRLFSESPVSFFSILHGFGHPGLFQSRLACRKPDQASGFAEPALG